jgi:hypothetical protein
MPVQARKVFCSDRDPFQDTRTDTRTGGTHQSRATVPVLEEPEPALLHDLVSRILT